MDENLSLARNGVDVDKRRLICLSSLVSDEIRCPWVKADPLYEKYHDEEWGVPVRDDRKLFEFLVLESAQAGLSWLTVLRKREAYRKAYQEFDPERVARFTATNVQELLGNPEIIRNRAKILASIENAKAFLRIQDEFGSFADYSWRLVDDKPLVSERRSLTEIPATTPLSDLFAKDMKARGFKFLGSTVLYAHMQAVGMVNDHTTSCFRYHEICEMAGPY